MKFKLYKNNLKEYYQDEYEKYDKMMDLIEFKVKFNYIQIINKIQLGCEMLGKCVFLIKI